MLQINVETDFRLAQRMLRDVPHVVEKAAVRSLNRTNDSVESLARRMIAKDMGIPAKRVKAGMFKIRAIRNKLSAGTIARGRPINLIRFKARQTKKGVSASAWGTRKVYPGTFIANKGRTVFKRVEGKHMPSRSGQTKHTQSIRGVWGPSIPKTMLERYILMAMQKQANSTWQKNFARDLRYYLARERL